MSDMKEIYLFAEHVKHLIIVVRHLPNLLLTRDNLLQSSVFMKKNQADFTRKGVTHMVAKQNFKPLP